MQKFRHHFFAGLLVLAPLFLTVVLITYLVRLTDVFIVNPLFQALPIEIEAKFKITLTKVAIGLFVFCFILLVGLFAEKFIFKKILSSLEGFIKTIPIFSKIYVSLKDIAQAFFGDRKGVFHRVVFLEYPRKGIYALGFITQERRWEIHDKTGRDVVTVFVPSPPNPATGYFIFVPREELIESDLSIEEGIKLVISGGAAVPAMKNLEGLSEV